MEINHKPILLNNSQIAQSSQTESTAAPSSNSDLSKTSKNTATVQATPPTPLDLGKLHESENFSSHDLEQLKRLAQIREILGKGGKDAKEDKKADALALDLLNTIKENFTPDEKNISAKNQHLETLQTNIESKKYADAIKGVGQMMELFELESRGAFTPVKNTKGGFLSTLIDTIGSYALGDVAGPNIVKLVKNLGAMITPKNLGENTEMGAKTAFGVAGFFGAEEAIGKFLDPMWEKLDHFLNHSLESKTPDMVNKVNASAHGLISSATHGILGLFGKKIDPKGDSAIESKYSESLSNKIVDYIRNQKETETQDKWAFSKLVKEMLLEDYQNHYGKPMPKPIKLVIDGAFSCVSTTAHTRKMLIANEGAEALKEPLEKFLKFPGKIIFHFFNDIVPNVYIFGGRPIAMYAINQKEQELVNLANKLGVRISKPSTAANNIANLDSEKAKTPATASAH